MGTSRTAAAQIAAAQAAGDRIADPRLNPPTSARQYLELSDSAIEEAL